MYENEKILKLQQTNRQTNGPRVGMSLHSDAFLLWFRSINPKFGSNWTALFICLPR